MASLTAAHMGYEYQDLLAAIRLVDVVLGSLVEVHVDRKLVEDDRFDDLTSIDRDGWRVRSQFKHTQSENRCIDLATFTSDGRGLRLDRVIASVLADRDGPGRHASRSTFRIVLRDRPPEDPRLTRLLRTALPDPGPFSEHLRTTRLLFDAAALWAEISGVGATFANVKTELPDLTEEDLAWVCDRLVVELGAPAASHDLTKAGNAEEILLHRVRNEVGAELFPNSDRQAIDVAVAFVTAARAARQGQLTISRSELLRRAQLRSDFGAVTRSDPVDRRTLVSRPAVVEDLLRAASEASSLGGCLLVKGSPGQGKSWVCQQLIERMYSDGWLVAEHYCFLGDVDGERLERVLAENMLGSLVAHVAKEDPSVVEDLRPLLAADEEALETCLARARNSDPSRPIALVVDGLDHITRVRPAQRDASDPSHGVAETLAGLDLPDGCVLIVLSQPGPHLEPLNSTAPIVRVVGGLESDELRQLAQRHGVITDGGGPPDAAQPVVAEPDSIAEFVAALSEQSGGNALYAKYLCIEALRSDAVVADPVSAVRRMPPFDGALENYYRHLQQTLGGDAGWVAEVISLATFGLTRVELKEIVPELQHRVDSALDVLAPVLVERASQGIRVYHESFGRFLRQGLLDAPDALVLQIERVAAWLESKGLFSDSRSYRFLLSLLAEAGRLDRVVELVGLDFVERSIAAAFPASAVTKNLATAIRAAAGLGRWPLIVRYVEMSRAAEAFESERYDSVLVEFADVHLALLGPSNVADRMLEDGRLAIPARAGLQLCAAIDRAGAVAPWQDYMRKYLQDNESDNTCYGEASDLDVSTAWARGRLRLASARTDSDLGNSDLSSVSRSDPLSSESGFQAVHLASPIDWGGLANWLDANQPAVAGAASAILDTHGTDGINEVLPLLRSPGPFCLAIAELAASDEAPNGLGSPHEWTTKALAHGVGGGAAHRLLALEIDVEQVATASAAVARKQLVEYTQSIQKPRFQWDSGALSSWLDLCAVAARRDPGALDLADALVVGDGWYRCWLRFAIALTRAEACGRNPSAPALDALGKLSEDLRPFAGDPRACDLFSIHDTIAETIGRAVSLLNDQDWVEGIRGLVKVSDAISTTVSGELGGPLPIDLVFNLSTTGTRPHHLEFGLQLIEKEITERSGGRFYSDLARYRLLAARLAIRTQDSERAALLWDEACRFLTGYGWHKDITIYELLDPLDALIELNPKRGRRCVADVQGLCERIPQHTDLRETRGAWGRWWRLLAAADPVALSEVATSQLLEECNEPNFLLYGAIEDLWRAVAVHADPVVAGALRLSLDSPHEPADMAVLQRLLDCPDADHPTARRLMVMLMARIDERPVSYAFSNADEVLAGDDARAENLNALAGGAGLPRSLPLRDRASREAFRTSRDWSAGAGSTDKPDLDQAPPPFPPGAPGLSRAIRAWKNRPHRSRSGSLSTDRFASVIGYRLVELADDGRSDEAEAALHTLADFVEFGDGTDILGALAGGLERHRFFRLSAVAYALAWTRTRGHGGWLSFGGETEIESLHRATDLDPQAALSVVADEVERFVLTDRRGTYGITQAIVFAFAQGALAANDPEATAFEAWDEARSVVDRRAPIVHPSDEPLHRYIAPQSDDGDRFVGDLDAALSLAIAAGMAHASRERKRRSFAAIASLFELRPVLAARTVKVVLEQLREPATLCWLMSLLPSGVATNDVVQSCENQLVALAVNMCLTVRATARRLLGPSAPDLPAAGMPHPALMRGGGRAMWSGPGDNQSVKDRREHAEYIVASVADQRIAAAEDELPGLGAAVRSLVEETMATESFKARMQAQVRAFADTTNERWPDAYLTGEQTVEESLQVVASAGRAARMAAGEPVADPAEWEDSLGRALLDDPALPLAIELTRRPRPAIPSVPPPNCPDWAEISSGSTNSPPDALARQLGTTVSLVPAKEAERVAGYPFDGWIWIATYELRRFSSPDFRSHEVLVGERYRVAELREDGLAIALDVPPITSGDFRMWTQDAPAAEPRFALSQPLVGMDRELKVVRDGRRGLGAPGAVLTPTAQLLAALCLRPSDHLSLHDDSGAAMSLVTWRADYDVSDHYLPMAHVSGCGIVIRPDLLNGLVERFGSRLVIRDYLLADRELATGGG